MQYRPFGSTGIQVSALGFGAMRLPAREDKKVDLEQAVPSGIEIDFSFPGIIFPGDALSGQGMRQDGCGLVFVDLVLLQVDHIEVIFPQALEAAKIVLANRMALAESRPFKLARPDFGGIMRQLEAHSIFHFDGFNHDSSP